MRKRIAYLAAATAITAGTAVMGSPPASATDRGVAATAPRTASTLVVPAAQAAAPCPIPSARVRLWKKRNGRWVRTNTRGRVKPKRSLCRVVQAAHKAGTRGRFVWTRRGRCVSEDSQRWHPTGRACDLVYGRIGSSASRAQRAKAKKMIAWVRRHWGQYNMHYLIWYNRIYYRNSSSPYRCSGVTDCHRDHIHLNVK